MRTDPDIQLIERMLAPPPLDDARRSLDYWRNRRASLPLHKRKARREAAEMAARWQERVREAERARFEATFLGRTLGLFGIRRPPSIDGRAVALFAWMLVPRQVKLAVGAGAAVMCLFAVLLFVAIVELLT